MLPTEFRFLPFMDGPWPRKSYGSSDCNYPQIGGLLHLSMIQKWAMWRCEEWSYTAECITTSNNCTFHEGKLLIDLSSHDQSCAWIRISLCWEWHSSSGNGSSSHAFSLDQAKNKMMSIASIWGHHTSQSMVCLSQSSKGPYSVDVWCISCVGSLLENKS